MSKQFQELAAKAYLSVNPGADPYNEAAAAWAGFGPLERKFAELIVEECIFAIDEQCSNSDAEGTIEAITILQKHFRS